MDFTIRPVNLSDAKAFNEMRREPEVFHNTLGIPSERIKRNEDFITNLDHNAHIMVAVTKNLDGEEMLIGSAGLHICANPRQRHSAHLGIMVHKNYQGMGVGTKLMETLIDLADNWLMLVRIELTVFTDNERAISLYKKFGFEIEGTTRKSAIRNGEYADNFVMGRLR